MNSFDEAKGDKEGINDKLNKTVMETPGNRGNRLIKKTKYFIDMEEHSTKQNKICEEGH